LSIFIQNPAKMEETSSNRTKYAMTYGAIIGLILVVYSVLLYLTDIYFNKAMGFIQYVIIFAGIYLGTKAYRDKALGGFIKYGRALVFGLIISVFVGIIIVFFNFIMLKYIDPGLIDKNLAIIEESFQNSRFIQADQMDEMLERSRDSMTAIWSLPMGVFVFALIGFVISLITSAFLKKDPNPFA
jgi:hypothetical protein